MVVTDFNAYDFLDIAVFALLPMIAMGVITYTLLRSGKSLRFLSSVWVILVTIIAAGAFFLGHQVQFQRQELIDYFAETAKAYAIVTAQLEHHKIQAGNEELFSDWSEEVKITNDELQMTNEIVSDTSSVIRHSSSDQPLTEKLAVPAELTAVRSDYVPNDKTEAELKRNQWARFIKGTLPEDEIPKQLSAQWKSVPQATTYRLQWNTGDKAALTAEEYDDQWKTVYSGSQTHCTVIAPDDKMVLRVRAENGTPEDDPHFLALAEAFTRGVENAIHVAYIYTMRFSDGGKGVYFVVSPPVDANHNGKLDHVEEPAYIGEAYDYDINESMRVVYHQHKESVNTIGQKDRWGDWVTAFCPIWTPDGQLDGMVGVDFPSDLWDGNVWKTKQYGYVFFTAVLLAFFGSLTLMLRLQHSESEARNYAETLNHTVKDLTEAKLTAEDALRVKGEFLANMSHEIRTPMNAVLGMTHLALQTELTEKQRTYLENANQSADLLLRIINDILDFSKIEAGKMVIENRPFSLEEIVRSLEPVIGQKAKNKNLYLSFHCGDGLPTQMLGDAIRLQQVLLNLLTNAVKFTNKGHVGLDIKLIESDETSVTVQFAVLDTGIGLSERQLSAIFKPFTQADTSTTRKYGGTGLGLAICKNIIELMHGKIWAESKLDCGTTFYFTAKFGLPEGSGKLRSGITTTGGTAGQESSSTVIPPELYGKRILLAEDNRINQMVASELLTMKGFVVDIAENGKRVLELLERNAYSAVLMDIQMPEMDGLEAAQKLRSNPQYADLPVIAMTAHAMSKDRERSLEAGMNDHITKPIIPNQLYETLVKWITV